jgi:hypothetical protein
MEPKDFAHIPDDQLTKEQIDAILDAVNWSTVPSDSTLPEQLYEWHVSDIYHDMQVDRDTGFSRLRINIVLHVEKPEDFEGRQVIAGFIVGTPNDPYARRDATWQKGASTAATDMKRLVDLCNVSNWRMLLNKRFGAFTRNNLFEGRNYTNLATQNFYRLGELTPGTAPAIRRPGRMNSSVANGPAASQAAAAANTSATTPCPGCGIMLTTNEYLQHVPSCNGPGGQPQSAPVGI